MTAPTRRKPGPAPATDYRNPDMHNVDPLAVEFACNGTVMQLNADERIIAARKMLGLHSCTEIARRIGTYKEEINRIARATPDTMLCPACRQRSYHAEGFLRRHVDIHGMRWCCQSGVHFTVKTKSIQAMARG